MCLNGDKNPVDWRLTTTITNPRNIIGDGNPNTWNPRNVARDGITNGFTQHRWSHVMVGHNRDEDTHDVNEVTQTGIGMSMEINKTEL